jgi:NAD(P)-dependent dehydrogenase (short-subunit alcohol dehydrogenase family)
MPAKWSLKDIPPQTGRRAVVTGGNRGLGLEIATALAAKGAQVIIASRNTALVNAAVAQIIARVPGALAEGMTVDLADLASIRRFSDAFHVRFSRLDLLVNNASVILVEQGKTVDGFERHFGVNVLGTFALTGRLIDCLTATPGARVVNTASTAHRLVKKLDLDDTDFERTPYKPMEAYGRSKLATLLMTFELDRRLKAHGFDTSAIAAHPGYSSTNPDKGGFWLRIGTKLFAQSAAMGALPALYAATAPDAEGGEYYGPDGFQELTGHPAKARAAPAAGDRAMAARLWDICETRTGARFLD